MLFMHLRGVNAIESRVWYGIVNLSARLRCRMFFFRRDNTFIEAYCLPQPPHVVLVNTGPWWKRHIPVWLLPILCVGECAPYLPLDSHQSTLLVSQRPLYGRDIISQLRRHQGTNLMKVETEEKNGLVHIYYYYCIAHSSCTTNTPPIFREL